MNRRKFFALLPAAPVAIATWPAESKAEGAPHDQEFMFMLNSRKEDASRERMRINAYGGLEIPPNDDVRHVTMAVGRDGSLWIRNSSDEWKRVVTQ